LLIKQTSVKYCCHCRPRWSFDHTTVVDCQRGNCHMKHCLTCSVCVFVIMLKGVPGLFSAQFYTDCRSKWNWIVQLWNGH